MGWVGYCFKRCRPQRSQPIVRSCARCLLGEEGCRSRKPERHICVSGFPWKGTSWLSHRLYRLIGTIFLSGRVVKPFGPVKVRKQDPWGGGRSYHDISGARMENPGGGSGKYRDRVCLLRDGRPRWGLGKRSRLKRKRGANDGRAPTWEEGQFSPMGRSISIVLAHLTPSWLAKIINMGVSMRQSCGNSFVKRCPQAPQLLLLLVMQGITS